MRQGGVLHVLHRQPLGLEGAVRPHVVRDPQASLPGPVEGHILEEIRRPHEASVGHLESGGDDPGRAVEPGGMRCLKGAGHEGAVMASPHPA